MISVSFVILFLRLPVAIVHVWNTGCGWYMDGCDFAHQYIMGVASLSSVQTRIIINFSGLHALQLHHAISFNPCIAENTTKTKFVAQVYIFGR